MLFNSFKFLVLFLPVVLFVSTRIRGQALLAWITLSSFVFYAFAGHVWFLIPMLVTTGLDFFLAQKIATVKTLWQKKSLLVFSLCGNLGLLFYFKYSGLFTATLSYFSQTFFGIEGEWGKLFAAVLPAGISFYTFQTLAYIVDVYRGTAEPEKNFWCFACFVAFFPHLVAGPLTRHHQLIPALKRIEKEGISPRWQEGIFLFVIGMSKKVLLADRIANQIDPIIGNISNAGFILSWFAIIGYAFQIYFDFSGYSDMAIGLGRLFKIELPQNFNNPYQAVNPADFWSRWHMTLSRWLRDYLYIPLGGNRNGKFNRYRNLFITMVLGGLWHGASWTFAVWGLYQGFLLVGFLVIERYWNRQFLALQKLGTFICVCFGWVFFRATNFSEAGKWFKNLFGMTAPEISLPVTDFAKLTVLLIFGILILNLKLTASQFEGFCHLKWPQKVVLGGMAVVAVLFMNYSSRFLYFQF